MSAITVELKIGGSVIGIPDQAVLGKLIPYVKGGIPTLAVYRRGGSLIGLPDSWAAQPVALKVNGSLYFAGDVCSGPDATFDEHLGWTGAYQCMGLRNRGDWLPHTDSNTGLDISGFNLQPEDSSYIPSRAGRTVGQILADVLQMPSNASGLKALSLGNYTSSGTGAAGIAVVSSGVVTGITLLSGGSGYTVAPTVVLAGGRGSGAAFTATVSGGAVTGFVKVSGGSGYITEPAVIVSTLPAVTINDLNALSVSPPTPAYFQGEKLLSAVESFLSQWTQNYIFHVDPLGNFRFLDLRTFTPTTLTADVDPIEPSFRRDYSDCFQRVVVRGQPWVEAVPLSLTNGGLQENFAHDGLSNSQAKTAWTPTSFSQQGTAQDNGTCTCPNTTTVSVTSSNSAETWAANAWDQTVTGRHATITLQYTAGSGINAFVTRRIISNTALTAGGTSTLTLDIPLPITSYNKYTIFGLTGGASIVWRQYKVVDPAIGAALADQFPYPQPYVGADGNSASLVSQPTGSVVWSSNGQPPHNEFPLPATWDSGTGNILFVSPTYFVSNNAPPNDVRFLAAVNKSLLQSVAPADVGGVPQYAGTSHSVEGLAKTLTLTLDGWRDPLNQTLIDAYAADVLDSVKDSIVEGTVVYHGLLESMLTLGQAISVAGNGYTTGWEGLSLSVVEVELEFPLTGAQDAITTLHCSNRRAALTAAYFLRPDRTGITIGTSDGSVIGGAPGYGDFVSGLEEGLSSPSGMLGAMGSSLGNPFDAAGLMNGVANTADNSGVASFGSGLMSGAAGMGDLSGGAGLAGGAMSDATAIGAGYAPPPAMPMDGGSDNGPSGGGDSDPPPEKPSRSKFEDADFKPGGE